MEKGSFIMFVVAALLGCAGVQAQELDELDSVSVYGTVINQISRQAESYCSVRFLQGEELRREVLTDENGDFAAADLPAGEYTLEVMVKGLSLHRENLDLSSEVFLSVFVITDSIKLVNLPEVDVNASRPKHVLAEQGLQITSAKDPRLKHFNYRWWIPWYQGEGFGAPASQMTPLR